MIVEKENINNNNPIYIIGAGGIINAAHLPAYKIANYTVQGICDINNEKAIATANDFCIPNVYETIEAMIAAAPANAIFDVAVPANELINILQKLPNNANVLLQKPMGENLADAKKIVAIAAEKKINTGVNFQLRYAPFIVEAKKMIANKDIGEIVDVAINVNVYTPWHLWDFLFVAERVEILYHSIHYVDLIRHILGNPQSVFAKTVKHPAMQQLASVKSTIIMDYGEMIGANINTNHCHNFGTDKQTSTIKIEGTKGAILINFGALINYPIGVADTFEYCILEKEEEPKWLTKQIEGTWFPHAFIGSMQQVILAANGIIAKPDNCVTDCLHTMACVEAAYESSINPPRGTL
jgi:predicted dehydrogenase